MTVYDLFEAIAAADDELLLRSETKQKSFSWIKYAALSACVVLVITAAFVFGRNETDLQIDPDNTTSPVVSDDVTTTQTDPEVTTTPHTSGDMTSTSESVTTSKTPEPIVNPGQDEFDEVAPPPFAHSGGDENAWYYEPLQPKLGHISYTLFNLVDEDEFDKWCESVNVLYRKGEDVPTDINGFLNVYAMINYFDVSDEEVIKAFEYELSQDDPFFMNDEDLNVLLSRDEAAILSHFASDYSIVIGDRIYSPQWVYENSLKAYKEAGITPEMLKEKLGLYTQFYLTDEAENYLINKINRYESSMTLSVGGSDYSFNRKYIDEVYNIHIASLIVGKDACDAWVNDIFLKKSAAEQEALPTLFQIIVDLEISKEDLINKNNEYSDDPDNYISDYIIDALYADDIETMNQLLINPMALYYNGEIYTFDDLLIGSLSAIEIPKETLAKYFDNIEFVCIENGTIKYMQEDIDNVREAYGLDDEYAGSLRLNGLEYVLNATWEPDVEIPELVMTGSEVGGEHTDLYSAVNMKLNYIDGQFLDIVGWTEAEEWLLERSTLSSDYTAVDEFANLYSFIKHFEIPDKTVREILINLRNGREDDFTDEEIELILSDDTEAVAEHFAHENAICKDENLYSVYWMYNHTIADYIANGLMHDDVERLLPQYEAVPMSSQARAYFMNKLNAYFGRTINSATGGYYDSYESLCADYSAILDDDITFIRYRVLERISANEAYELTGKKVFANGTSTLYKVQLTYDCLNDTVLDEIVYLGRREIDENLQNYKPAYAIGEEIVSYIDLVNEDKFGYYFPDESLEFAVYEINGLEFAYHIGSEQIEVTSDKYQNLDLQMASSERLVITSTADNPVNYTQKSLLSELTSFIDEDWATRRLYFPLDESGSIVETDDAKRYAYVVSMFSGSYDEKQCKFVMDSYWIESLFEILPEEEIYRFRDEVYYNQTLLEQAATPPLYQAVMYFGITREELSAADRYLPEYVLDAIYCGDESEMKQLLMNEYSIYHDGEVYALYDLVYRPSLRKLIPFEKRVQYIEKIRDYLESDADYERVYKKFIEEMLDEDLSPEVEIYPEDSNIIFTKIKNDSLADEYVPENGTYSMSPVLQEALKSEHNSETRFAVKLDVYGISNSYIEEYNEIASTADTLRSPDNLTKEQVQARLNELAKELPELENALYSASDDEYYDALSAFDNAVFERTFVNFSLEWHNRILDFKRLELEAKRLGSLGIEVLGVDQDMRSTCEIVAFITEDQLELLTRDENVGYKLSMATEELCKSIENGITIEEMYLQGLELAYLGERKGYDAIESSNIEARYNAAVYEMLYNPRYNWENCHYCGMYVENGYLWIGTGNDVNEDILLDWISNDSIAKDGVATPIHDSREDVKYNHACKGDFKTLINTFLNICAETDENGERLAKKAHINFGSNQIVVTVSSEDIADELRHKHGFTLPYFKVE